jgi:hypothetical protein
MRRFSLLIVVGLLALVVSGCFGGSADKPGPTSSAAETKHVGEAELDILLHQSTLARQSDWRFHVSCPHIEGDVKPTLLCQRITSPVSGFFGVPASFVMPAGGSGSLRIRGTVNGVAVNASYGLGQAPQYPNWTRVLFGRPLDAAVRYAGEGLTNGAKVADVWLR